MSQSLVATGRGTSPGRSPHVRPPFLNLTFPLLTRHPKFHDGLRRRVVGTLGEEGQECAETLDLVPLSYRSPGDLPSEQGWGVVGFSRLSQ